MSISNGLAAVSQAMVAQAQRLNLISSNIANINTVSSSEKGAFKAMLPVFKTVKIGDAQTVVLSEVIRSKAPSGAMYAPNNPLSDVHGYIYSSNVDRNEMAADLVSAQQSFSSDTKVFKTLSELQSDTIKAMK
ncbi:flagellar basal body rod protein FlgC [Photobacterium damselae]|uniref:flagellar basal body rod protein FlgC n=1 Tax=Photobacterium damselae TaxID=38293 RepID=UPI001EEF12E1|nr:flagellar basal body rod C-terminal domain-containing protein [Photobacterium damselae]UKA04626.1 flagellar basal body protein [Photobacterium damselae subsp. damselae]